MHYRRLNYHTVNDKFLIPLVNELLKRVQRAIMFSKINLRSRYHQVQMATSDIHKTTFRTHEDHYEFTWCLSVSRSRMPPPPLKGLWMLSFREHLRKFDLVFFDDILIHLLIISLYTWRWCCICCENIRYMQRDRNAVLAGCKWSIWYILSPIMGFPRTHIR